MITTDIIRILSQHCKKDVLEDYSTMLPLFDRSASVPKNLLQICIRNLGQDSQTAYGSLPSAFQDSISSLRKVNEGWDYHLYSDIEAREFVLEKYGERVYSYFERINPKYGAARADFLRYLLLYCFGGAYIDIKCGVSHSLDSSIESGLFPVFYWDNMPGGNHHAAIPQYIAGGEILQGFIVTPAGHPFMRSVIMEVMKRIDEYNPYIDGVGYGGVMKVTGPGMYTETIYDCSEKFPEECYMAKPFAEFGFVLHNVANISKEGGGYQQQVKMTDYRKETEPLVSSGSSLLDYVNRKYLSLIAR